MNRILGARVSGLGYVLRENTAVAVPAPARAVNEPYSGEYGSIDGDHFNRLSHSHALYKIDNGTVYDIIEHGTRWTFCDEGCDRPACRCSSMG